MFNITMDPTQHNIGSEASCTTCTFAEDFSNYWTATLFFRARNGSYTRVPQRANVDFDGARNGGVTVYYTASCKPAHSSDQKHPTNPPRPQTKTPKSPPSNPASAWSSATRPTAPPPRPPSSAS